MNHLAILTSLFVRTTRAYQHDNRRYTGSAPTPDYFGDAIKPVYSGQSSFELLTAGNHINVCFS